MKSDIERHEEAIVYLFGQLNKVASRAFWDKAHKGVQAILNPVEYEEIEEIAGWVNVYQNGHGGFTALGIFSSEDTANYNAEPCRISCQPIKVTVQREKPMPVERSARVVLSKELWVVETSGDDLPAAQFCGTLTWTEEPTT